MIESREPLPNSNGEIPAVVNNSLSMRISMIESREPLPNSNGEIPAVVNNSHLLQNLNESATNSGTYSYQSIKNLVNSALDKEKR